LADRRVDREKAAFTASLMAANKHLTEKQALELYHIRDAVHALLAFPVGKRIVIDKSRADSRL